MKKLLLKYAQRRLEQCLFLIIFAIIIWVIFQAPGIIDKLIIVMIIILPIIIYDILHLWLKMRKMPEEVISKIESHIENPEYFNISKYAIFDDIIISFYKCKYIKIKDITKIKVKPGYIGRYIGACLYITMKDGKKQKLEHKETLALGADYYKNIIPYLLEKNPDIEIIDNYYKLIEDADKKN